MDRGRGDMNHLGEWIKAHKVEAAGIGVAILIVLYLLFRSSSSSSNGISGALQAQSAAQASAAQYAAQTQAAQIQANAQVSAQNAQLAATQSQNNAQLQAQQDYIAGQIISQQLGYQYQNNLVNAQLGAQEKIAQQNLPLEQQALQISTMGNRAQTGQNELALLEAQTGSMLNPSAISASSQLIPQGYGTQQPPTSFGITLPSGIGFGASF